MVVDVLDPTLSPTPFRPTIKVILDDEFVKRKMAVFSKDAVAAALDQLCLSLDEAKGEIYGRRANLVRINSDNGQCDA